MSSVKKKPLNFFLCAFLSRLWRLVLRKTTALTLQQSPPTGDGARGSLGQARPERDMSCPPNKALWFRVGRWNKHALKHRRRPRAGPCTPASTRGSVAAWPTAGLEHQLRKAHPPSHGREQGSLRGALPPSSRGAARPERLTWLWPAVPVCWPGLRAQEASGACRQGLTGRSVRKAARPFDLGNGAERLPNCQRRIPGEPPEPHFLGRHPLKHGS